MKMWAIWNRGYTRRDFAADTAEEALAKAKEAGHIRRGYRKYRDVTDEAAA